MRVNSSFMAVQLPSRVPHWLKPVLGMLHIDDLTLLGIHSTKYPEFFICMLSTCSSTSLEDRSPRYWTDTVRYLPSRTSGAIIIIFGSNMASVMALQSSLVWALAASSTKGANETLKKCRRGKGIRLTASLRRSELRAPAKRSDEVLPDMAQPTSLFSSANSGDLSFSLEKHRSYRASLSR